MTHTTPIRVRFYELDPFNHVNHSAYIQYFEVARIELLRHVGWDLVRLKDQGTMIVVTEIHTRFLAPAHSGDDLLIETEVVDVRRVTTKWRQRLVRGSDVLAVQELTAAVTNLSGRPVRFPPALIAALEPYLASG